MTVNLKLILVYKFKQSTSCSSAQLFLSLTKIDRVPENTNFFLSFLSDLLVPILFFVVPTLFFPDSTENSTEIRDFGGKSGRFLFKS